jgi:hypothetical protein
MQVPSRAFLLVPVKDDRYEPVRKESNGMLFFRKSRKNSLNQLDLEKIRQPLPGLRSQSSTAQSLSGVLGDAQDGLRQWSSHVAKAKEPERVFPWEVPSRGEVQWE